MDRGRALPSEGDSDSFQEMVRAVMLQSQEQDGKRRFGLFQAATNGKLFIVAERRADDHEMIMANIGASNRLLDRHDKISGVTSVGEEVRART